jgi:hypothetical protein
LRLPLRALCRLAFDIGASGRQGTAVIGACHTSRPGCSRRQRTGPSGLRSTDATSRVFDRAYQGARDDPSDDVAGSYHGAQLPRLPPVVLQELRRHDDHGNVAPADTGASVEVGRARRARGAGSSRRQRLGSNQTISIMNTHNPTKKTVSRGAELDHTRLKIGSLVLRLFYLRPLETRAAGRTRPSPPAPCLSGSDSPMDSPLLITVA